MNSMYKETAKMILSPNRFRLTKEERNGVSREQYRNQKRVEPRDIVGAKHHFAGTVCQNANYKAKQRAWNHYQNIGLGISLRCPIMKAFKSRYRGGAWNK